MGQPTPQRPGLSKKFHGRATVGISINSYANEGLAILTMCDFDSHHGPDFALLSHLFLVLLGRTLCASPEETGTWGGKSPKAALVIFAATRLFANLTIFAIC